MEKPISRPLELAGGEMHSASASLPAGVFRSLGVIVTVTWSIAVDGVFAGLRSCSRVKKNGVLALGLLRRLEKPGEARATGGTRA